MQRIDYAKDKRTIKQYKKDFKLWKTAEAIIAERLEQHFWVEYYWENEKFSNEIKDYKEDALIWYWNLTMKIDIKYTKVKLKKWVQLKVNQADKWIEQWIHTIIVSDNRVTLIDPKDYIKIIESWYCDKPCYLYRVEKWYNHFSELQEHIIKNYE